MSSNSKDNRRVWCCTTNKDNKKGVKTDNCDLAGMDIVNNHWRNEIEKAKK